MKPEITLRLIVIEPPDNVHFALQSGKSELAPPISISKEQIVFEWPLTVADTAPPRLTGKFAQGSPKKRFVYVNSGSMSGQEPLQWRRRAKIMLEGITTQMLEHALHKEGLCFEATIYGKAKDGGPACATVPFLHDWVIKERPHV